MELVLADSIPVADLVLELVEGEDAGRQVTLDRAVELGRDPGAGLALTDDQVSRHHARIVPSNRGATVEDLGSTNGTYVNDQPLVGPRSLVLGDRVRVGLTVLELRSHESAAQVTAIAPRPNITRLDQAALGPLPEQPKAADDHPSAGPPAAPFATEESEPAFVPREVLGDEQAESDYVALASLVDHSVKHRAVVAAYAVLALAGIALIVFFAVLYR